MSQAGGELETAVGLCALARQLFEQRAYDRAREALERARPVLQAANHLPTLAFCLHYLAATLRELGLIEQSERTYREALPVHQAAGDLEGEARSHGGLAFVSRMLGNFEEALEHYDAVAQLWAALGNEAQLGLELNEAAVTLRELDRHDEALEKFDVALAIRRGLGDPMALGITLHNRGVTLNYLGRVDDAVDDLQEALPFRAVLGPVRESATHHELGQVLRKLDRFDVAIESLEGALALRRSVSDPAGQASTLNELGVTLNAMARYDEAVDRLQSALPLAQTSGDTEVHGLVLHNLGLVLGNLGRPEDGVRQLDEALDLWQASSYAGRERESLEALLIYLPHAHNAAMDRGDLGAARSYAERNIEIHELLGSPSLERVEPNAALAIVLCQLGDLAGAQQCVNRATGHIGSTESPDLRATVVNVQGLIAHERGDLASALDSYREALRLASESHPERSSWMHNIGAVYLDQGDTENAIELFEQVLSAPDGIGSGSRANTLNSLGGAHYSAGNLEESARWFGEALEINKEIAPGSADVAIGLNNLGLVLVAAGRYKDALDLFENALGIAQAAAGVSKLKGAALGNIGLTYRHSRDYDAALPYLQQALAVEEAISPESFESARCRTNIASIYCDRGEWDEAIPELTRAVEAAESLRARAGTQRARELVFAQQQSPFDLLVRSLYHRNSNGDREQAFRVAEGALSRTLVDLLSEREVEISPDNERQAELLALDKQLRFDLASTHRRLQTALESSTSEEAVHALQSTERDLERHLDELREQIRDEFEAYADLRYPEPVSLAEVQGELADDTLLLEYALTDAEAFVFCIRGNDFEMIDLPWTTDQLTVGCAVALAPFHPQRTDLGSNAAWDLARTASEKLALIPSGADTHWEELARTLLGGLDAPDPESNLRHLSEVLLTPIPGRFFEGVSRVLIVQDGVLSFLPFEMLPSGESMFLDRCATAYVPSATTFTGLTPPEPQAPGAARFVGFGDPEFGAGDDADGISRAAGVLRGTPLPRLPGTLAEVNDIARLMSSTDLYTGPDATELRVKTKVSGHEFVHFATHGLLDDSNPLYSGLALAPPTDSDLAQDPELDDFLQVYEMFGLPLNDCKVVVCSACQTGLGKIQAGEGLVGFSRALLFAGASCVVLSLWPVPDFPTARLMERFYEYMSKGLGVADALREAKIDMIQRHPIIYEDPRTWAAFVAVGSAF